MGLWSSFGSSMLDSAGSGLMSNIGMVDYEINPLAREGYEDFWNDSRSNAHEWNKLAAEEEWDLTKRALRQMPSINRQAMEAAGFNPILAVNSAAGQPFSTSLAPSAANAPSSSVRSSGIMENMAKEALIKQTEAQTKYIDRKTEGEGWIVKTLTRSEALGLGTNLLHVLGFNFHDSSQQTFLVAYNTITGELRNLGDTQSGLGTTGQPSNAAEVNVEIDGEPHSRHHYKGNSSRSYWDEFLNNPPKSPLR